MQSLDGVAYRPHAAYGDAGQSSRRGLHGLGIDGGGVLERGDEAVRTGTFGRTGYGAEVAYVPNAVEDDYKRRFVLGHTLHDILYRHIFDG